MIKMHDGKGEFLAWLKNTNRPGASYFKWQRIAKFRCSAGKRTIT